MSFSASDKKIEDRSDGDDLDQIREDATNQASNYNEETDRLLEHASDLEGRTNQAFVKVTNPSRKKWRIWRCCFCIPCCKPKATLDDL